MRCSFTVLGHQWRLFQVAILMLLVPRSVTQISKSAASAATSDIRAAALFQDGDVPTCYFPDGTIAEGDYACNLGSNASACCTIRHQCTESGLCSTQQNQYIFRTSCTDRTWNSPECAHFCMEANTGGTNLISCANVTNSNLDFCCDHTTDCCETGVGRMRLAENDLVPITTIASSASVATRRPSSQTSRFSPSSSISSSRTFSTAAATTPSTSGFTSPQRAASSGVSTGAAVGIGIGSGCGTVGAFAVFLFWRRRRRMSASASRENTMHESPPIERSPEELPGGWHSEMQAGNLVWEMGGNQTLEAPGAHQRWELASQNPKSRFSSRGEAHHTSEDQRDSSTT